jgi:hypothetical protein
MADGLRVERATLEHMQQSLSAVARNFEGLHEQREDLEKIWGTRAMRDVMGDFADNWTTHRDKLREHIEELGKNCEETLRCFGEVDAALAAALGSAVGGAR